MDTDDKIMFALFGFVGILVGGFVLAALSSPFVGVNLNPGSGEKVGQVVRMTNEGIVCKTYEAQLIRGGLNNGTGAFGVAPFEFTVPATLVEKVQEYMDKQVEVKISYSISGIYATCNSGSGGHYLTSIEVRQPETEMTK